MSKRLADRLDWNQMLGFEQVADHRGTLQDSASKRLGAKVGPKPGVKPISPVVTKIAAKIGVKIGEKTGLKPID